MVRGVRDEAWISYTSYVTESFVSLFEYFRFIPSISDIVQEN